MFAHRLKALRIEAHQTQKNIAMFLGMTRQGYAKYENFLGEPTQANLIRLADYFQVSTDYLLGYTHDRRCPEPYAHYQTPRAPLFNDPQVVEWFNHRVNTKEDLHILMSVWELIQLQNNKTKI